MLGQMTTASGERKRQSLMEEKKKRIEHGGLTRIECAQLGISFSGLRASVSCSCRLLMEAEKLGQGRGEKAVKGKNQITQFGSLFVRKRSPGNNLEHMGKKAFRGTIKSKDFYPRINGDSHESIKCEFGLYLQYLDPREFSCV